MPIKRVTIEQNLELEVEQLRAQLFAANSVISNLQSKLDDVPTVAYTDTDELRELIDELRFKMHATNQGGLFYTKGGFFVRILASDPPFLMTNSKTVPKPKWLTLTGTYHDPKKCVEAAINSPILSDYLSSMWPELEVEVPEIVEPEPKLEVTPELEIESDYAGTPVPKKESDFSGDEDLDEEVILDPAPWTTEDEMTVYLDNLVGQKIKAKRYFIQPEDKDGGYSTGTYLGAMVDEASGRTLHKIKRTVGTGLIAKVKATVIIPETIRPYVLKD